MSVFDNSGTTQGDPNNMTGEGNQDFLTTVVNAKGEQWKDPQVLAKGYVSSQEYILELENKNKELASKAEEQNYAKQLLEQLQDKGATAQAQPVVQEPTGQENTTPSLGTDDIKSLVSATLEERQAAERANANVGQVDAALTQMYGDKAKGVVEAKAKELGMSVERMRELAAESPSAFLSLVQVEAKKDNALPVSQMNTSAESFQSPSKRNFAFYQKLRKEDSKSYQSAAIQEQMLKDRIEQGQEFYS